MPCENHFSIDFSPDSKYLANLSSNGNVITLWETKNFSLKYSLDLPSDSITKLSFAPNGKDLVLLSASSKVRFYRVTSNDGLKFIKEAYGVTDLECTDFSISPNN